MSLPPRAAREARAPKRRAPEPAEQPIIEATSSLAADAANEPSTRRTQHSARRKRSGTEPEDAPRAAPATGRTLPSPVPAGAQTDPLGVLPSDLASLVLGFIPLRPRMLSVSLVSKRWRAAVLRSARTFRPWKRLYSATSDLPRPPLTSADLEATLRLFPSLTDLALDSYRGLGGATLRLPTTLRTLSLCDDSRTYCTALRLAPPLPSGLTSLKTVFSFRWEAVAAALLAASATSLASLHFSGLHDLGPELIHLLERRHFPSLTSITLACDLDDPLAMSTILCFLKAHASQLLNFTLHRLPATLWAQFPRLKVTELCVLEIAPLGTSDALPALLAQCPQLTSLTLSNATAALAIPPEKRTLLRSLQFTAKDAVPPPLDQFPNLTRLGRLCTKNPLRLLPNDTYATVLRSLELRYSHHQQAAATLAMCTNLEALTFTVWGDIAEPSVRLPLLEELELCNRTSVRDVLRCLRAFVEHCPRLRSLYFDLPVIVLMQELESVCKFMDELRRTSVESVRIACQDAACRAEATELLCKRDGWLDVEIRATWLR